MIPSYGKVWNIGHPAVAALFDGPVIVQEKIDGSQISFGVLDGVLHARSKGAPLDFESTDNLFRPALDTITALHQHRKLHEGMIYRGETLHKPKHNTLSYARVPHGNIVLFDVNDTHNEFRGWHEDVLNIGLEWVPDLYHGTVGSAEELHALLTTESMLGGTQIEGVVAKRYDAWDNMGQPLRGKYVSEAFKETHKGDWKDRNPNRGDMVERLVGEMTSPARWEKARIHLAEAGELTNTPADIGKLLKAAKLDIAEEEREYISGKLFDHFISQIQRGAVGALPGWYKEKLMEGAFG